MIKNKKILITGGVGFIGFNLAKKLSNSNKVYIWDNLSRGKKDVEFRNLLTKKNIFFSNINLNKIIISKLKNFDFIFHLAGTVGVQNVEKKAFYTFTNNINATINLINFVKKNNKKAKLIIFSTSEVYSNTIKRKNFRFPISEKNPVIINNKIIDRDSYFLSKIFNEKLVQLSGLEYLILRPHNIYGPRMGYSHVIPELIKKFKNEKERKIKFTEVFSPKHKRAFCYIDDAIHQILSLATKTSLKNDVFNIGNMREEVEILKLAKKLKSLIFKNSKIKKGTITLGSPERRVPDMKKTLKSIPYKKFINLNEGLMRTYEWYSQ